VDRYLQPVAGLGPFTQINVPIVGTDNFDFLLQGVPNLVANRRRRCTVRTITPDPMKSTSAIRFNFV
jgi:hypothetical protein